jgi:hypothetical protein
MRMRITFAAFFITALPLTAQDTTKPFYFPHKTGDMWEYIWSEYPNYKDTLQNFIILDSTDSRGIIHITQHARSINPIEPSIYLLDTAKYWLDTVNHYVYGPGIGTDSTLVYKLNAQKGERWIDTANRAAVKVLDRWEGNIFGRTTEFMEFSYYSIGNINDTLTWQDLSLKIIANGFGLVFLGGGESYGEINLVGAIINDTLYGDTTVVFVKDKKNFLPSSIKLYQNYPNPFNSETRIEFSVPKQGYVSLKVYDILGKLVKILMDNEIEAGWHQVFFKAENLSGGVYFYTLQINGTQETKKMIFLP